LRFWIWEGLIGLFGSIAITMALDLHLKHLFPRGLTLLTRAITMCRANGRANNSQRTDPAYFHNELAFMSF
jgi:hypothetical protein